MGVTWTEEQQKVIDLRNRNILVSAAAGSGKTAVLVERIITMLTADVNPIDVAQLLIVTFTEAAAAEMKERIRNAIEKKLEKNCRKELSIHQKQTIYYNIYRYILSISILDDRETSQSLRNITFEEIEKLPVDMFGTIVNKRYEYEALVVLF